MGLAKHVYRLYTDEEISAFVHFGYQHACKMEYGAIDSTQSELDLFQPEKNHILNRGGSYQLFMYKVDELIKGRIAVFFDPEVFPIAFIGLFACVNDPSVSDSLFAAAKDAIKEKSCSKIVGPIDGSIFNSYRIMTEGFNERPFLGEPRNLNYYANLFTHYGFKPSKTWETLELEGGFKSNPFEGQQKNYDHFLKLGYATRQLKNYSDEEIIKWTYQLISKSYEVFPYYTSIAEEDFIRLSRDMPTLIDKNSSLFLFNAQEQLVGVIITMRDLFFTVQKFQNASMLQKLSYFFNSKEGKTFNMLHGASLPIYIKQAYVDGLRNFGEPVSLTSAALYQSFEYALQRRKYDKVIVTLIRGGAEIKQYFKNISKATRKYCLFELDL